MIKLLLFTAALLCFLSAKAQQIPFYNHYLINPFVYNPAMAGFSGDVNTYFVRNQRYTAFNGGAINNYLTVEGGFMQDKAGIGLSILHQKQGIQQQLGAGLTYAYKIRLSEKQDLRFGITAGILDNRLDVTAINVLQSDDPYLMDLRPNMTSFDMNAGLAYRFNNLKVGIAVPQVLGNKVTYSKEHSRGYYQLARHIMGSVEYDFHMLEGGALVLRPQTLVRYVPGGAPVQYDVTAHLEHGRYGWFSVTYKSDYALQFNAGVHIRSQLHVGFSYEYLTASMKTYSSGMNHEFLLGYTFKNRTHEVIRTVEVQVHDTVRIETDDRAQTDELLRKNQELEALHRKALEEKKFAELQKNMSDSLRVAQSREINQSRPKEATPQAKPVPGTPALEYAKGYRFIEPDGTNSPDGIYIISGVFSSKENADLTLQKNLADYPDAYLVINQRNGYYYVVIVYTTDEAFGRAEYKKYVHKTGNKTWILKYRNEP